MNKYTDKKLKNQELVNLIKKFVSETSLELIEDCSTFLMFASDESMEKKKQYKGNSCKNRFCPVCSWKKAKKDALAISVMMKYLKQEENKEFIFLTLTAPNISAEELNNEVKHYNKSFKRLMERKEVKKIAKGYIRKLEITYNKDRFITKEMYKKGQAYYKNLGLKIGDNNPNYNTYHPHFHVLIAVNKSYFTDKEYYITHKRWLELWQESTKNPLITQVNVQKVSKSRDDKVYEVAKYSAKDSDYLVDENVFEVFYRALKGKRLLVYSGLFSEANKKFKKGELDKYKEMDHTEYVYALMYNWGQSKYVELEKRCLTEEEQKDVNHQLMEEIEIEE